MLVILNSSSAKYREAVEYVLPYCDHFGFPYRLWDLNSAPLPETLGDYPLFLIAHQQIDTPNVYLPKDSRKRLFEAVFNGSGLVSFDPTLALPEQPSINRGKNSRKGSTDSLEILNEHFITRNHALPETIALFSPMHVPGMQALPQETLIKAGEEPFLVVRDFGQGRLVQWGSSDWMDSTILGPMEHLDDLFWRSLVWAARKPFALRGLPPLVSMRVDDVVAHGASFGQAPFYWVHESIQNGFKPWLGLFLYNLSAAAIHDLREMTLNGSVTCFPHALGRPPRSQLTENARRLGEVHTGPHNQSGWYYEAGALELTDDDQYDQFIYFNHYHKRPFADAEARRRLWAVDRWYENHSPLPVSTYALPHWYEMGKNTAAHMQEKWNVHSIGKPMQVDLPLIPASSWLKSGPFRKYESPGTCFPHTQTRHGHRPVYYADFVNLNGYQFFNSLTEIRDVAGYEWEPDNDVEGTVKRGIQQISRAIDSMALSVLFTHETDYLMHICPENWVQIIKRIAAGVAHYQPIQVTLDEGVRYTRAMRTSHFQSCGFNEEAGQIIARFTGKTDLPTHFYLFTQDGKGIDSTLVEVPVFDGQIDVPYRIP
jgi:hypothetical protein